MTKMDEALKRLEETVARLEGAALNLSDQAKGGEALPNSEVTKRLDAAIKRLESLLDTRD